MLPSFLPCPREADLEPCLFILDLTYSKLKEPNVRDLYIHLGELVLAERISRLLEKWLDMGDSNIIRTMYSVKPNNPLSLEDYPSAVELVAYLKKRLQNVLETDNMDASLNKFTIEVKERMEIVGSMLYLRRA